MHRLLLLIRLAEWEMRIIIIINYYVIQTLVYKYALFIIVIT
jgi:hypothetical protein